MEPFTIGRGPGVRRRTVALPWALALALAGGCSAQGSAPAGAPVPDPAATAAELTRATTPDRAMQAAWAISRPRRRTCRCRQ